VLTLIKSHALLHQSHRDRDEGGRIVANLDDYRIVRGLVADLVSEGLEAAISPLVLDTVAAVAQILKSGKKEATGKEVGQILGVHKSAASRRIDRAIAEGYLRNMEPNHGRPSRLVLGEPLPRAISILPPPEGCQLPFLRLERKPATGCHPKCA
jgi:hypothetical protein|tara:strand:- start:121 stop:582 length:462 start_codon:yes stop_codon:yes gene_type:complete